MNSLRRVIADPYFCLAVMGPLLLAIAIISLTSATFSPVERFDNYKAAIFLIIFLPLLEEAAFRGFLQDRLGKVSILESKEYHGITASNVITSITFTALHFFHYSGILPALTFIPSLIFGFFKDRTGGISAPFFLHALYNAGFLSIHWPT